MRFANPGWLWFLLVLPLFAWWFRSLHQRRLKDLSGFVDPALWPGVVPEFDPLARLRRQQVWLVAVFFLVLALARPQWGRIEETVRASGLDVVLALDVSQSMDVEDIAPSRIKKARHMMQGLIDRLQGDRLALVAFAGSAYLACPLTTDAGYVAETLSVLSPRLIQNQGSDLGIALDTAARALDRGGEESKLPRGSESASKAVVVFSDGEDHQPGALEQARLLKERGIRLYVIGLGSEKGGPIPLRDEGGRLLGFKKDAAGAQVVSSFRPRHLSAVAQEGGGKYFPATPSESEVEEIVSDLGRMTRGDYAERRVVSYQERYQLPLLLAVFFILTEWSLALAKRASRRGALGASGVARFFRRPKSNEGLQSVTGGSAS
jgi:Ca-activated chloride channel family protein